MQKISTYWPWLVWLGSGVAGISLFLNVSQKESFQGIIVARTHIVSGLHIGKVKKLYVKLGQSIKKRDLLLDLDRSELISDTEQFYAPFDGVVSEILAHEGQVIHKGEPILKITSSSDFKIEAYLLEGSSFILKDGQLIHGTSSTQSFQGKVLGISPSLSLLPARLRSMAAPGQHGRKVIIGELSIKPQILGEVVELDFN